METFDYLIVGAGYAGSILAERLASGWGKKVLLVDRRSHIAGNAYDHYNDEGILVHKYGPHIFHTNSKEVFEYLGQFTGKRFEDLIPRLKRRVLETELVVHVIRHGTPDSVKDNIFARINTGGLPLSRQELRHALISGKARVLLREWAKIAEFQRQSA